ncbi:hypothetical protein PVIIG_05842 [Plasmodium vivax India VII]|uniref:VIR protein n=1 Tax=Plasmodium vivax India VII TaxID=1077284 RepID=A0A0J9SHF7_PLAVI|nr:hypothetical protein PVIIG_05842 [Plasmodium vivax India VII]
MASLFRGFGRYNNPYQKHDSAPCMNRYSTLKSEISQKIDDFYNATHENIYNEWFELYKYINENNASIKHCVVNGYIGGDLNEDEKIKNSRGICNKSRICHINVEFNINTNPPSKRTGRVQPCRGKSCKTETPEKVMLRSQLEGESSKATRLQRPKAQSKSRAHAGGEESNKQSEALPAQSDVMTRLNSIKSEDHEPKPVTNKESSTSVKGSTSLQALLDIGGTPPLELNLQEKDSPSKSSFAGESDAEGTLQVNNPSKGFPQNNLTHDQTLGDNPCNMQTHQGGDVENKDHNHEKLLTEHSDRVTALRRDSDPEKLDTKDSVDKDNIRAGNNDVARALEHTSYLYTINEDVVSAPTEGVSSDDASLIHETYGVEGVRGVSNGREIINGQEPGREHLCNGTSCRAEQFTPLWRVLTKKNRKNGAGIIEELNSVVQEPSIMNEESIPFSYGAFEYSTFD